MGNLFEFNDVGKEIKQWAKWIAWILFIGSIVVGIGMIIASIVLLFDSFEPIVWATLFFGGFLEIAIGYVAARLEVIVLYGFGELIDQTMQINRRLWSPETSTTKKDSVPNKVKTVVLDEGASKKHSWRCPVCNNIIDAEPCQYCNQQRESEEDPNGQGRHRCPTCNRWIREDSCPYCEPLWGDNVEV